VREKSPVISTTLASEVSGARAAEANTAPIAITAYSAGRQPTTYPWQRARGQRRN
jgi:hypothetical protein